MSLELAVVGSTGIAAYLYARYAFNLGSKETGEESHEGLKLLYFGVSQFFGMSTLFTGGYLAAENGYADLGSFLYILGGISVVLIIFLIGYVYMIVVKNTGKMLGDGPDLDEPR